MNRYLKPEKLSVLIPAAGCIGLILQLCLMSTADEKGFVASGHICEILTEILTVGVVALLIWQTRDLVEAPKFQFNFPASLPGFAGTLVAALGICVDSLIALAINPDLFTVLTALVGLICAVCLVYLGLCRREGLRPSSYFYVLLCFYMALRLVSIYRHWSSDPQVEDYGYSLLATVCLMLAMYYRALFNAGMGKRRMYAIYNLAAVYFCCLSLTAFSQVPFYLGCGAWMLTDLCSLAPLPRDPRKPSEKPRQEEP